MFMIIILIKKKGSNIPAFRETCLSNISFISISTWCNIIQSDFLLFVYCST